MEKLAKSWSIIIYLTSCMHFSTSLFLSSLFLLILHAHAFLFFSLLIPHLLFLSSHFLSGNRFISFLTSSPPFKLSPPRCNTNANPKPPQLGRRHHYRRISVTNGNRNFPSNFRWRQRGCSVWFRYDNFFFDYEFGEFGELIQIVRVLILSWICEGCGIEVENGVKVLHERCLWNLYVDSVVERLDSSIRWIRRSMW